MLGLDAAGKTSKHLDGSFDQTRLKERERAFGGLTRLHSQPFCTSSN